MWVAAKKLLALFCTCLVLALHGSLVAQEEGVPYYTLDPVIVTHSRIPEKLSNVGQSVSVISREQIELLPVHSIPALLQTVSGVDLRQRGAYGVQADVGIRGSSFEQTLILVDGVNVSDAQTGHHNLDIPVNLEDIERIEIVKGPGARVYGHNAMAGVINIITRAADHSAVGGYAKRGDYDYWDVGGQGNLSAGHMSNHVSVSQRSSSGHIEKDKTGFDIRTLAYKGAMNRGNKRFKLDLGYVDKDFGAYRFYTDTFPNQRERTETMLAHTSACFDMADSELVSNAFWRRHNDDFEIEIADAWQRNRHQSDAFGIQLNTQFKSKWGTTAVGGEAAMETLQSSNLGDHDRQRSGLFFEQKICPAERWTVGVGTSAMNYSDWGWEYWPGTEMNFAFGDGLHWFASAGRSFRIPTYTELYYDSPANQGNPDLDPEHAWTYESGMRLYKTGLGANFSLFLRDEKDVIDWFRESDSDPWRASNITERTTQGFELGFDLYPGAFLSTRFFSALSIAYTYLDADWDTGEVQSKYVLDQLCHQVNGSVTLDWFEALTQVFSARYQEHMSGDSYMVVDMRLLYKKNSWEAFLDVTNLFDEEYVESGFSPMPGRWIVGGIRFNMDFEK
jgi:iron complex outermembrane receptor protein